jgi:NAD-dependent deacetylase
MFADRSVEGSEELATAAALMRSAKRLLVLTGAGVSAESGIATFRDDGGLWDRYPPGRFATASGLLLTALVDPTALVRFVAEVLGPIARARPNLAHRAIAELERHAHVTVATQNIDGLHQEAGSVGVRQVHGSLLEVADVHGRLLRRIDRAQLLHIAEKVERAAKRRFAMARALRALWPLVGISRHGSYRPDVVLFGETLRQPDWDDAQRGVDQCDLMVVVGTSAMVMPAAALPQRARARGAKVILLDPVPHARADVHLRGKAGELLPALVHRAYGAR